jgi:hypothetical protein
MINTGHKSNGMTGFSERFMSTLWMTRLRWIFTMAMNILGLDFAMFFFSPGCEEQKGRAFHVSSRIPLDLQADHFGIRAGNPVRGMGAAWATPSNIRF